MEDRTEQRRAVLNELLDVEKNYVKNLKHVLENYYFPLNVKYNPIIKEEELKVVFGNFPAIAQFHEELLRELQLNKPVADVFVSLAPFLKQYIPYANSYRDRLHAIETLKKKNKDFKKFLESCIPSSGGKSLTDYLINPIQQIPRYKLLLKDLMKTYDPNDEEYHRLQTAMDAVHAVAEDVNMMMKIQDGQRLLENIGAPATLLYRQPDAPPRQLILEGTCGIEFNIPAPGLASLTSPSVATASSSTASDSAVDTATAVVRKDRRLMLFSDILVLAKPRKKTSKKSESEPVGTDPNAASAYRFVDYLNLYTVQRIACSGGAIVLSGNIFRHRIFPPATRGNSETTLWYRALDDALTRLWREVAEQYGPPVSPRPTHDNAEALAVDRSALEAERAVIEAERAAVAKQRSDNEAAQQQTNQEKATLKRERELFELERQLLHKERSEFEAERERWKAEHNAVTAVSAAVDAAAEREREFAEREQRLLAREKERDKLLEEREKLLRQREDELAAAWRTLQEKAHQDLLERERLDRERLERLDRERQERERQERERLERERLDRERERRERLERERERREKERLEREAAAAGSGAVQSPSPPPAGPTTTVLAPQGGEPTKIGSVTFVNVPLIKDVLDKVLHPSNRQGWVVCNYLPGGKSELILYAYGFGGVDELVEQLRDDQFQYILLRLRGGDAEVMQDKTKDIFITWIGPGVGILDKGRKKSHKADVTRVLQPFHVELEAISRANFTEATVRDKIKPLSGSHVID